MPVIMLRICKILTKLSVISYHVLLFSKLSLESYENTVFLLFQLFVLLLLVLSYY